MAYGYYYCFSKYLFTSSKFLNKKRSLFWNFFQIKLLLIRIDGMFAFRGFYEKRTSTYLNSGFHSQNHVLFFTANKAMPLFFWHCLICYFFIAPQDTRAPDSPAGCVMPSSPASVMTIEVPFF